MLVDWSAMTLGDLATRFDAVLIGEQARGDQLALLVSDAGGRVATRLRCDDAVSLDGFARRAVIVADLREAGDRAEAMLDRVTQHRDRTDCPVVIVIDPDQIDVAAALAGQGAQLLCTPTDRDLVAAMLIAGGLATQIHDTFGEGEGARLQRLNEEVARIAETLSRLAKREPSLPYASEARQTFDTGPSSVTIEAAEIRRTIRARRLRDRQFGQGLFEDPAWDMMLDLFAAELEHGQVSVSSLCVAAAVAPTTALRWIGKLVDAGLFRREPDPFDRRRAFIGLSPMASAAMRSHVAALRAAGLPLA